MFVMMLSLGYPANPVYIFIVNTPVCCKSVTAFRLAVRCKSVML